MSIRSVLAVAVVWRWRRVWKSRKPRPEEFSFSGAMRNDRQQQTCIENLLASPASLAQRQGGIVGGSWVGHDKRRHWTSVALSSPHSPDCAVGAFHHPGEEEVSSGMNTIFPSSRLSNARSVSPLEAWPRRCSPCLFRLASVNLLSYLLSPSPHSQRESRPPFLWTALLQTRPHCLVW